MDRRSFIRNSGIAFMGASLPGLVRAGSAVNSGRLVFGIPAGALGGQIADSALALLAREYKLDYRLDVIADRNTQTASETVKRAAPDGMTLLQSHSSSMVLFPSLYRTLKYDPVADFRPLAALGWCPYSLTLGPAVPEQVKNLDGYLSWVSQNPDFRDIGFTIFGSQGHLLTLMLARQKEIALRPQAYVSTNSMLSDLAAGHVAAAFTLAGTASDAKAKGVRSVTITSRERMDSLPGVPTFAEQQLPDLSLVGWYGWFAPAATPGALIQGLHDKVQAIQSLPEYVDMQKRLSIIAMPMSPEAIEAQLRAEIASYRKIIDQYSISKLA